MDSASPRLDFAAIGHQDNWHTVAGFVNGMRLPEQEPLGMETIKEIFPFIPPRELFRVKVRSGTGSEINGVYIETFIDPDKLSPFHARANIAKVKKAIERARKLGCGVTALGGFTSIVLEGNAGVTANGGPAFTTGNTLTAAFIVKGVEKAAGSLGLLLRDSTLLIIGATGDIGSACTGYMKTRVRKLLLCARKEQELGKMTAGLRSENIAVECATCPGSLVPAADIIISVASSSGIALTGCRENVLICDAGYPKNLDHAMTGKKTIHLFYGGMGQATGGYQFSPGYADSVYRYAAPFIIHGCLLEAMVLAFEKKYVPYSTSRGQITVEKMDEIYRLAGRHGIAPAPFFNAAGLWEK